MERDPGLAPGKSGFAIRRLDVFGMSRGKSGDQWDLHPTRRLSQSRMLLLHHGLHRKMDPATGAAPV
jgi:hypothetical protein